LDFNALSNGTFQNLLFARIWCKTKTILNFEKNTFFHPKISPFVNNFKLYGLVFLGGCGSSKPKNASKKLTGKHESLILIMSKNFQKFFQIIPKRHPKRHPKKDVITEFLILFVHDL